MKVKITENKRNEVAIKYLNKFYSNLIPSKVRGYTIYIDEESKVVFRVSPNKEVLEFDSGVLNFFKEFMGFEDNKIKKIILNWFNKTYNQNTERWRIV